MEKDPGTARMKVRIPPVYFVIVIGFIIIAGWIIAVTLGLVTVESILLDFIGFISMLVVIAMLAVLGAIFLGMFISHKILAAKGFTPFERAMLEMREDITRIDKRMENLEKNKSNNPGKKK